MTLIAELQRACMALRRRAQPSFAQPGEASMTVRGRQVICYHPRCREIGEAILTAGGNAFDAFVAVTAAENVLSEGASSLAGALGVLIYRATDDVVSYLDGGHNDPLDPEALWTADAPAAGKAVLVPGAPAALHALVLQHGRLPLDVVLAPAIALAEQGFPVGRLMATTIAHHAAILRRTDYGRRTYLPHGKPPQPGDTLQLPVMAAWLNGFARQGADYVYRGEFGRQFIATVQAEGGLLTEADLAAYRERWFVPWTATFRDVTLHSCSGRTYGGLWALLALKTLEHAALAGAPHYSQDADLLERMIRIAREVWAERFLFEDVVEDEPADVQARLTADYTAAIWQRVGQGSPGSAAPRGGTHSFHIIVVDDDGNIASGTTTAQSDPWADGIFVEGLLLTASGRQPFATGPGRRRLCPFSIHLGLRDSRPLFSVGAISNSAPEAAFQLMVNLIDHRLPVHAAVRVPRFGTFPPDRRQMPRLDRNWIDPRIDTTIVRALRRRGLKLHRRGLVDTGLGAVLRFDAERTGTGATSPIPYVAQPFSTRSHGSDQRDIA
jgi:gamma-glutamyltranspeptidase/glutathione hydrolase